MSNDQCPIGHWKLNIDACFTAEDNQAGFINSLLPFGNFIDVIPRGLLLGEGNTIGTIQGEINVYAFEGPPPLQAGNGED